VPIWNTGEAHDHEAEARSRLAAIVASSQDAIIGKTLEGVITSWNAAAADIYGYTAAEVVGRNVSVLFPPDRAGELASILDRLRRGERIEHYETQRVRKDGRVLDVSVSLSPVLDAAGRVIAAATVARDITERNRTAAERHAFEARLHRTARMETIGRLAGGIAHDFNNLLAAITGYAELLAEETAGQPELHADVQHILATAERASRLTRDLLTFSRRGQSAPEPVDLNAVISGVRSLLATSIGQHITLRLDLAARLPRVLADSGQCEQLLVNLAVNARDAMPRGGALTIATQQTSLTGQTAWPLSPGTGPGRYAMITVTDTGIGISPQTLPNIFEPFFTTKGPAEGSGLGLSTVYGIVAEAGGAIAVESAEGTGTVFRIHFPVAAVPAAGPPAAAPARPRAAPGQGETILVVDDEPAVLQVTTRILRSGGYATLGAGDAPAALSMLGAHDCEMLLTDSVMPGITGADLVRHARDLKPGLRVMQMSGNPPPEEAAAGVSYIQKPFSAEDLLGKVRVLLDSVPRR